MRDISPTANEAGSYPAQYDLQTQVKVLQSESVLERVIAKLHLEKKLSMEKDGGRLSVWRTALGLPESLNAAQRSCRYDFHEHHGEDSYADQVVNFSLFICADLRHFVSDRLHFTQCL